MVDGSQSKPQWGAAAPTGLRWGAGRPRSLGCPHARVDALACPAPRPAGAVPPAPKLPAQGAGADPQLLRRAQPIRHGVSEGQHNLPLWECRAECSWAGRGFSSAAALPRLPCRHEGVRRWCAPRAQPAATAAARAHAQRLWLRVPVHRRSRPRLPQRLFAPQVHAVRRPGLACPAPNACLSPDACLLAPHVAGCPWAPGPRAHRPAPAALHQPLRVPPCPRLRSDPPWHAPFPPPAAQAAAQGAAAQPADGGVHLGGGAAAGGSGGGGAARARRPALLRALRWRLQGGSCVLRLAAQVGWCGQGGGLGAWLPCRAPCCLAARLGDVPPQPAPGGCHSGGLKHRAAPASRLGAALPGAVPPHHAHWQSLPMSFFPRPSARPQLLDPAIRGGGGAAARPHQVCASGRGRLPAGAVPNELRLRLGLGRGLAALPHAARAPGGALQALRQPAGGRGAAAAAGAAHAAER